MNKQRGEVVQLSPMAVIRTETENKVVIAHDTLITFEGEPLKIYFDDNPHQIRGNIATLKTMELEVRFKPEGESNIVTRQEGNTLIVELSNAKSSGALSVGVPKPIKIGSNKVTGKNVYLNFAFSNVNSSYMFTYMIYLEK